MSLLSRRKRSLIGLVTLSLLHGPVLADSPVVSHTAQVQSGPAQSEVDRIRAAIVQKGAHWTARVTPLSGLPLNKKRRWTGVLPPRSTVSYTNPKYSQRLPGSPALPARFDWRNYNGQNYVSSVKDQGQCGSCWAFAVTAALESKAMITQSKSDNLDLSEQIVLSCSQAGSCDGGWPDQAASFLTATGTAGQSYYPYTAQNGSCSTAGNGWQSNAYKMKNWTYVVENAVPTVDAVKNALSSGGPLVVTMNVYEDFFSYSAGVYSYTTGALAGAHAVVIVGWNDADQAFIIKNSWGEDWGEAGYFEIGYSELNSVTQLGQQMTLVYGDAIPPNDPCSYTLSKYTDAAPAVGESGSVNVSVNGSCTWNATSNAKWLTLTSGKSGTGNGSVAYKASRNTGGEARSGALTIGSQTLTVTQSGTHGATPVCALTATPDTIAAGSPSTLAASCNPAATSYQWINSGFAPTSLGGQVSPNTTTVYSVVGSNAAGSGNTASATVTVTNGVPLTPTSLLAPVGVITGSSPAYRWNAVAGATAYYVNVQSADGTTAVSARYDAATLGCATGSGVCSVTPNVTLVNGATYVWTVLAANHAGYSPWSMGVPFSVNGSNKH
jgi:C1A family cysteine protease